MAKLAEILPLLGIAAGSALSPQGGQAAMNISQVLQNSADRKRDDERYKTRETRAQEAHESTLSLNDLRKKKTEIEMTRSEEEAARKEEQRQYVANAKAAMADNPLYQDLTEPEWMAINDPSTSLDVVDKMLKARGKPPLMDSVKMLQEAGLKGSVTQDGVTAYVPGKTPIETTTPGKIFLDLTDDDGYKSSLNTIKKLYGQEIEAEQAARERRPAPADGKQQISPVTTLRILEKQKITEIDDALERAAILTRGDETAMQLAVQQIFRAANMTAAQYEAIKRNAAGGAPAQSIEGGTSTTVVSHSPKFNSWEEVRAARDGRLDDSRVSTEKVGSGINPLRPPVK